MILSTLLLLKKFGITYLADIYIYTMVQKFGVSRIFLGGEIILLLSKYALNGSRETVKTF